MRRRIYSKPAVNGGLSDRDHLLKDAFVKHENKILADRAEGVGRNYIGEYQIHS